MENLVDFALQERYKNIKKLGDRLDEFSTLGDWGSFRQVVGDIYTNTTEQGGRPNMDIVLMVKLLVLQSIYNLSDPELERQANDRISFMKFLDFPEKIPDQTTVWYFRERLAKTGKDKAIWKELQRQLEVKGLEIRKGRSRMQRSSQQIPVMHQRTHPGEITQRPGEVRTVHGRKRV
jgi:IS5 family transposase